MALKRLDSELVAAVKKYIKKTWRTLERSHQNLWELLVDPKLPYTANILPIFYISSKENEQQVAENLQRTLGAKQFKQFTIKKLPNNVYTLKQHGALYLPHNYIVPGGRFNEMYGWDSFFIVLGLLHDGEIETACGMVENALYQVRLYGKVLNANRTYHLDRSHPPLLSRMMLAVFHGAHLSKDWLKHNLDALLAYHGYWTTPPHLVPPVGLSRYYALSSIPAPEVVHSELDGEGRNHYERAAEYYKTHKVQAYPVYKYFDFSNNALRATFYRADRAGRESGFDPSSRYGPLNADILNYVPVCLNTLLYQMEVDIAKIYELLEDMPQARFWSAQAAQRAYAINYYCWDYDLGYYFDYNIIRQQTRPYIFATTFYPLWAKIAAPEQAQRVAQNLPILEARGGLLASAYVTGNQWDAPFGWAPLHYFAIRGLHQYGYHKPAKILAQKFLRLVTTEFSRYGTLFEKYNVSSKTSHVKRLLKFGYQSNEIGFGWTNAIYLDLLHYLQHDDFLFF